MLVASDRQWLTGGGGNLEWQAVRSARDWLAAPADRPDRWLEEMPLAAALGQCCGGLVHLLFERLRESDRV
jgi:xanthine dehydrogenase accessory factor